MLLVEQLLPPAHLQHEIAEAAAIAVDRHEHPVPERPSHSVGAMPRSRQISAMVWPTGRRRTSASMLRHAGQCVERERLLRAGAAGGRCGAVAPAAPPASAAAVGGWRLRRRFRCGGGLRRARCARARQDHQVAAARGAPRQHALQRDGAHDAALEVRQDDRDGRGAEELRDGGEAAPEGAMLDGVGEVAAVCGEDAGDGEDFRDALGHGLAGPVRWGSGGVARPGAFVAASTFCTLTRSVAGVKRFCAERQRGGGSAREGRFWPGADMQRLNRVFQRRQGWAGLPGFQLPKFVLPRRMGGISKLIR